MSWNGTFTAVAGAIFTASQYNTYNRDNIQFLYDNQGIFPSQVKFNATINATINAATNDWNPTGLATCYRIRLDVTGGSQNITGIAAQPANTHLLIQNINTGANDAILKSANASSSSSNRFALPGGADINIRPNGSMEVFYDGTLLKWVPKLV